MGTPASTRRALRKGRLARPAPQSRAGEPLVSAAVGAATRELYGGGQCFEAQQGSESCDHGVDGDGLEPMSMPMPPRTCLPSRIGAVTPCSAHSRTSWSGLVLSKPVTAKQIAMVPELSPRWRVRAGQGSHPGRSVTG